MTMSDAEMALELRAIVRHCRRTLGTIQLDLLSRIAAELESRAVEDEASIKALASISDQVTEWHNEAPWMGEMMPEGDVLAYVVTRLRELLPASA